MKVKVVSKKEQKGKGTEPEEVEVDNELCPLCKEKKLVLIEREDDIPYFGKAYLFSMTCSACKFHKADVECADEKEPARYTIDVGSTDDMKIRVVKSSQATVKIPHIATIEPGPASQGYVTNIEGIISRIKQQTEMMKEDEDEEIADKARKLIKKLNRITWGEEKTRMIIEDPSGNSAIISDKAIVEKMKHKKD